MTLYEMNQMGYANLPKMAKSEVETMKSKISDWLTEILHIYDSETNIYFMLLNNESHYYTIFNWRALAAEDGGGDSEGLIREIFSIIKDLGTLKSIEPTETGDAWEFWITGQDAVTRMYLLFDYTRGVIEV